jgi:hypothetical protein
MGIDAFTAVAGRESPSLVVILTSEPAQDMGPLAGVRAAFPICRAIGSVSIPHTAHIPTALVLPNTSPTRRHAHRCCAFMMAPIESDSSA